MDQEERVRLEEGIIGSCLFENGYNRAKSVLNHSDFNHPRNLIYTAFIKLDSEGLDVDLRTTNSMLRKYKIDVSHEYLVHCALSVSRSIQLSHCLMLVERNLYENICSTLRRCVQQKGIEAEIASNCFQKMVEKSDILKAFDLITAYVNKRIPNGDLAKSLNEMYLNFNDRCQKIKTNLV